MRRGAPASRCNCSNRRHPGARLTVRREVVRSFVRTMVHTHGRTRTYGQVTTASAHSDEHRCRLSTSDLDELYTQPTREFGELIGKAGHTLVWGGFHTGLMKVVADGVQASGGWLAGISVVFLRKRARKDVDEMTFARDLAERKTRLLTVSDAIAVMPGGVGTLDEATEVLELRKHGLEEARTVRQARGAAEHGGLLRRADTPAPANGRAGVPAVAPCRTGLHRRHGRRRTRLPGEVRRNGCRDRDSTASRPTDRADSGRAPPGN